MNTRLIAYRKATVTATAESTYELDFLEEPNVSLNFQFSDIKEPETRQANYSQTFKLPFTENNNEFFQNWFEVNLDTLVFDTRKKFDAVLMVGSVPQIEGYIQLKGIYKKAEVYEVVLMSTVADLFGAIGNRPLRDIFKNEDGSYSAELNHLYTVDNLKDSWEGSTTDFKNTAGESLQDADAGVQKITYPFMVSQPNRFFYKRIMTEPVTPQYLGMYQEYMDTIDLPYAMDLAVNVEQFKPAIQLKTLFKLIIARAGFQLSSNFINGSYFGKLYMTTCGHLANETPPTTSTVAYPEGYFSAGMSLEGGSGPLGYSEFISAPTTGESILGFDQWFAQDNLEAIDDVSGVLSYSTYIEKKSLAMNQVSVEFSVRAVNLTFGYYGGSNVPADAEKRAVPVINGVLAPDSPLTSYANAYGLLSTSADAAGVNSYMVSTLDISDFPVGTKFQIQHAFSPAYNNTAGTGSLEDGGLYLFWGDINPGDLRTLIEIQWNAFENPVLNKTIDIPTCIDPSITQRAFLKDIIERFNLVIIADPEDATSIIIEPYNDYLDGGKMKDWTDKLDLSKEVVVKDTSSLQKRVINLTDLEDVDLLNEITATETPQYNVWGKYYNDSLNNDFASG